MKKKLLAAVLVLVFAFGVCPGVAAAVQGDLEGAPMKAQADQPTDLSDGGYHIVFNGGFVAEGTTYFVVDEKGGSVTPQISLCFGDENEVVSPDCYDLTFQKGVVAGFHQMDWVDTAAPLVEDQIYRVMVTAKEGSGYTGSLAQDTTFWVITKYVLWPYVGSFNIGAAVQLQDWPWLRYDIPFGQKYDFALSLGDTVLDPSHYTLTWYDRSIATDHFYNEESLKAGKLEAAPTQPGQYFALYEGIDPYKEQGFMDFDIVLPADLADSGYVLAIDGAENWNKCFVDGKNGTVTPKVELFYKIGDQKVAVPAQLYQVQFKQRIWKDDSDEPEITDAQPPFGVQDDGVGNGYFAVAVPAEGSYLTGQTTCPGDFNVLDKHTLNYIGVEPRIGDIPVGEGSEQGHFHAWHNYFRVTQGSDAQPFLLEGNTASKEGTVMDPSHYTVTYYDWSADQNWEQKESAKLSGFPTKPGSYYAVFSGVDPYYGQAFADFDVVDNGAGPAPDDFVPMYRLYNPNTGEHFYTAKVEERDAVVKAGWDDEGIGWLAPTDESIPVYRLYNQYGGEHHYTMDPLERDMLVGAGWNDEGIGWYSDPAEGIALLREYNPYAFACNHNYTTDQDEHDNLVSLGWVDEGKAWFAVGYGMPKVDEV